MACQWVHRQKPGSNMSCWLIASWQPISSTSRTCWTWLVLLWPPWSRGKRQNKSEHCSTSRTTSLPKRRRRSARRTAGAKKLDTVPCRTPFIWFPFKFWSRKNVNQGNYPRKKLAHLLHRGLKTPPPTLISSLALGGWIEQREVCDQFKWFISFPGWMLCKDCSLSPSFFLQDFYCQAGACVVREP